MSAREDELTLLLHGARDAGKKDEEFDILFSLARLHYENNEFDKAKLDLLECQKLRPKFAGVNYFLALIAINSNDNDKASRYLKDELKVNPNSSEAKELMEKLKIHSNVPLVTITLILLNTLIFLFIYPEISYSKLIQFALNSSNIHFAQIITSLFFHVNLYHLLANMIVLLIFGLYLEKHIGSVNFFLIYVISGFIGNFSQAIIVPGSFVLGASTGVFAIIGSVVMRDPLLNVRFLGIINIPIILLFGSFFAVENLLQYYFNTGYVVFGSIAHIVGFLCGIFITGIIYNETIDIFYNWLGIAAGFWLMLYGIRGFDIFSLGYVQVVMILCGILLISYSYFKLRLIKKEEVHNGTIS